MTTPFYFIRKNNIFVLYFVLSIMSVSFIFDMTLYGQMYPEIAHLVRRVLKLLRFILVVYFICNLDFRNSYIKQLLLFICFIVFCFISHSYIRNWIVFDIFFVPLFLSGILERQRLVNSVFWSVCFAVFSVIVLHFLNLLPDPVFYRSSRIRYALGFLHPNLLGFAVLFCCFLFILKKRCLDKIGIILLVTLSFFCYFIPNSNSSSFLVLLLILLSLLSNYLKRKILTLTMTRLLFVLSAGFVLLPIIFSYVIIYSELFKDYIISLPGELWARFSLAKIALDRYEITLFGTQIAVTHDFTVDFAYTFIPISYGIVVFVFYVFFILYSIKKSIYRHSFELSTIFILMSIYGISETVIFTPLFMFVFLCAHVNDSLNKKISSE